MTETKSRKHIWLMVPAIVSFLLLAAHFSRQDMNVLAIISLAVPLLLFIKNKTVLWLIQLLLFAGAGEWMRSTIIYVNERIYRGEDWLRLAIILSAVALFAFISAMLLSSEKVRKRYK